MELIQWLTNDQYKRKIQEKISSNLNEYSFIDGIADSRQIFNDFIEVLLKIYLNTFISLNFLLLKIFYR